MKRASFYVTVAAIFLLLASCSSVPQLSQFKPLSEGEARLTGIEMPEYVRENLPYEVILRIDSEVDAANHEGLFPLVVGGAFFQLAISFLLCEQRNLRAWWTVRQFDRLGKPRFFFILRRCLRYQDRRPRKVVRQGPSGRSQRQLQQARGTSRVYFRRTGASDQRGQDTSDR